MKLSDIESVFNRAFAKSFSRRKILFLFPILIACGILTIFCRMLSLGVNDWVWMSLSFLPIFLSTGVLLAAGVMLTKMYIFEIKGVEYKVGKLFTSSLQMVIGVSYLCFPLILTYLILWAVLGVFYMLKQIPAFGDAFGTLLAFGPYLLVLGSFALAIVSVMLLFFITPHVALKKSLKMDIATEVGMRMKQSVFANTILFFTSMIPLAFVLFFLILGAVMTGTSYFAAKAALAIGIQWLVMMVPFCFIMTPFVIFFFNFALESYMLLKRQNQKEIEEKTEACLV
jgi:hypothetical protein